MSFLDAGVIAFFALWLSATALRHLPEPYLPGWLMRPFATGLSTLLLPTWNFFAPRPGVYTYHLLYRDQAANGQVGPWQEVRWAAASKRWRPLWNPAKMASKALIDLANDLNRTVILSKGRRPMVLVSMPYLSVLAFITGLPRLAAPRATQFLLMQSTPSQQDLLFLSDLHAL